MEILISLGIMNRNILQKTIELRHTLHMHPELSLKETETKRILMQFLKENTSWEIVDFGNWVYALKRAEKNSSGRIAFRAEMDALPMDENINVSYSSQHPGVSHKCGHDGHMAALCGLAMELEHHTLSNTVYLIFQPAEEIGKGALFCKSLIQREGISQIYAFHNLSGYPEGALVYHSDVTQPASEGLKISLAGKTSHAAEPEKGVNPAHALSSVALYAEDQMVCEQSHMLLCTITGIQVGNGDFGISPGKGEICMTLRSDEEPKMKKLEKAIIDYASLQCREFGLQMDYQICDYFPETRNHKKCLEKVLRAAELTDISVMEMNSIWRPSEDFGYYLKECPGAMFYIGNGEQYPAVHTSEYDFNDRILRPAIEVLCKLALVYV